MIKFFWNAENSSKIIFVSSTTTFSMDHESFSRCIFLGSSMFLSAYKVEFSVTPDSNKCETNACTFGWLKTNLRPLFAKDFSKSLFALNITGGHSYVILICVPSSEITKVAFLPQTAGIATHTKSFFFSWSVYTQVQHGGLVCAIDWSGSWRLNRSGGGLSPSLSLSLKNPFTPVISVIADEAEETLAKEKRKIEIKF